MIQRRSSNISIGAFGFTLIEVIIAMLILSFLSLFTVEAIQRALQTKIKVQGKIDKNSTLRDALKIMERDINMAFNYRDMYVELYNQTQQYRQKSAEGKGKDPNNPGPTNVNAPAASLGTTQPNADRYKLKEVKIVSQFIGDATSLNFTSTSNVRMIEDSPTSNQAEIGYKLKSCRRRSTQEVSTNCLWRRVANYIHDDITKFGQETVLLENVTELKFRYLGPGKEEEWVETWFTNERGDDLTKNKFPYAVEITIAIKDTSPKAKDTELRMTTVAAIRNPNNPPAENKDPNAPVDPNAPADPNNPNPNPNPARGAN